MKKSLPTRNSAFAIGASCALAMLIAPVAQAAVGQLGILDTSGNNPATGNPWQAGDKYHLIYVTTATTDATSTDIADYNSFVQADAASQTGTHATMATVSWFAFGSTQTTDAIDNVAITGPVINISNNGTWALNAADMWNFSNYPGSTLSQLDGSGKNIWAGTVNGGTADAGNELGATTTGGDPGTTRRYWSHWSGSSWVGGFASQTNSDQREMVAISEELTVVPEPASAALFGLGSLALLRRRRK